MKNNFKKVPVILQMEAVECGAASLGMVLGYYKKFVSLEQLRVDCNVSRDGSSAKYIYLAAQRYGLKARAIKAEVDEVKELKDFPVIIHWNFNHFVVLCGFKGDKAVINDPAEGRVLIEPEEFDNSFTGIVLEFSPTEEFEPSGKPQNTFGFVKRQVSGSALAAVVIVLAGFVIAVCELVKPVFYKLFTDNVLIYAENEWMRPILLGMTVVLVVCFIAEVIESVSLALLKSKMSIGMSSVFMWHILRLPVQFFSQRYAGDIASRQESNNETAENLCTFILPVALDVLMIGIYLFVMLWYNLLLAFVGIGAAVINVAFLFYTSRKNANSARTVSRDEGKLSGVSIAALSMIETIKSSGSELGFFEKIAGYRAKHNNSTVGFRMKGLYGEVIPEILQGLSTGAVLMIGVYLIFKGDLSIGSLMAFQSFMLLFLTPVGNVADSVRVFWEMSGDIDRTEDVLKYPTDVKGDFGYSENTETEYKKLTGKVEVKNLCFAYSPLAPSLLNNFSLKAEKGQMIAIAGGSGSGKSTAAKIICGLYPPRSGEVLFDGVPIDEIDRYVFKASVASVDQEISLFSGTIRDNITMWDDSISEETIISACRDACIHDDIMALVGGYEYKISEGGGNFSGGQRQRLEIARALAVNPSILILDEATSALDPPTEKLIMDAVKRRGITCFVIAHRLSAIRDADEIIILDKGVETERGTHEELIRLNGHYARLAASE